MQCFSTRVPRNFRVPRVAARETERNCLGQNSQTQFYAVLTTLTLGSLHRDPWATQTFAEGSAAAQRLKNTVPVICRMLVCVYAFTYLWTFTRGNKVFVLWQWCLILLLRRLLSTQEVTKSSNNLPLCSLVEIWVSSCTSRYMFELLLTVDQVCCLANNKTSA